VTPNESQFAVALAPTPKPPLTVPPYHPEEQNSVVWEFTTGCQKQIQPNANLPDLIVQQKRQYLLLIR
jgi:hypothetical protein